MAEIVARGDDAVDVVEDGEGFGVDLMVSLQEGEVFGARGDLVEFDGPSEADEVGVDLDAEFDGEFG